MTRPRVAGPPSRRAPVLTLATVLVATLIGGAIPAAALPAAAPAAGRPDTPPGAAKAAAEATAEAGRTGKRVEITAQRTENEEVWANPDGTLTSEQSVVPTRVRRGGTLVPVDTGLRKLKDGRIAPQATRNDLTFSGGGTAPLATLRKDGRDVTLTWPRPLPVPTLDGNSATYAEVLRGVDLRVAADATGFSHQLIVKTRAAAADPALASLDFGLKGNGLTLRKEPNGELRALDPAGRPLFTSAKPQMWDSGADQPAPAGTAAAPSARSLAESAAESAARFAAGPAARPAGTEAAPPSADRVPAVDGMALGTRQADLGVELKGDRLTLTTDRGLLTAPDTAFPVVIDPVWRDDWKSVWALAYKHNGIAGSAGQSYWNGGTLSKEARVGCAKDAAKGNAVVCAKTFFQIGTGALAGKQVLDATFRIQQKSAGSWSCKSGDIQIWDTDGISTATSWNNQPAWKRQIDASGQSYGGRNCPGESDTIELNVTSALTDAARWGWPAWTMGLKSATDTVDVSWRKLNPDSARISTRFNSLPAGPSDRGSDPSVPCSGGQIGTTDQVVLRARIADPEDNALAAEFHYWQEGDYGTLKSEWIAVTSGNVAQLVLPASPLGSRTYRWDVRGHDGTGAGPWAGQCLFSIDRTRPGSLPGVSSPQFPENDPDHTAPARTKGTFTFTSGGVGDIVRYQWWTDSDPTVRVAAADAAGGRATVEHTPATAGPNTLYVQSLDASGNRSDLKSYLFYAKRQATRDRHGDLNGDGTVDIWSVDPGSGQLWMHPGKGDGSFDLSRRLERGSFADAVSLTHRGSWGEDGYEDLIALRPSPADRTRKSLWLYPGMGTGDLQPTDANAVELSTMDAANNHWAQADQVLAVGSVNDDDGDGKADDRDQPDLLVKEGGKLWLYLGSAVGYLDFTEPVLLGNADWQDMTLIAPGDVNGDALPDLWARDKTSGKIHQYASRKAAAPTSGILLDLAVYGDPAVRTTAIGTGFTSTAQPHLASNGSFEQDGFADLWSRDANGQVTEFPGRAPSNGSVFGAARRLVLGGTSWSECQGFTSAATGTHTLCGPILAKFLAMGGTERFGHPTTDVTVPPDGAGRFAHLRTTGSGGDNASIYWHPSTGAWTVLNGIRQKWFELGAERGVLGYPTSDEHLTFDQVGWSATFTGAGGNGAVYWTPDFGAWSVRGTVYAKYLQTGGPGGWLGYPTTDETNHPDGVGRYNHFRHRGQTSDTASVYWTTTTGQAWSVRGSIRQKWIELGAERSYLGYPQSDEYDVAGGPREDFSGGYIRHNRSTGGTLDHRPTDGTAHLRTELAGDFNGDGRADLATVYDYGSQTTALYTLPAKADGGFGAPVLAFNSGYGNFSYAAAQWVAGDFNADGRDDLAALYGYGDGANGLFTFLGNADGTFTSLPRSAYVGPGNWDAKKAKPVAGDFNGDGRDDVAFFYDHGGATGAHTFLSKADGTFNASFGSWNSGQGNWYWNESTQVAGDFNGDGRDDILGFYGHGDGSVEAYTLLARPDGGFSAPFRSWNRAPGHWAYDLSRITSGDYNGDGRADLAIMFDYGNGRSALFTLAGKPDGGIAEDVRSWEAPEGQWYAGSLGRLVSGDTDRDGRDDLAVVYNHAAGSSAAHTFRSRADGGFDSPLKSWQAPAGTW
ncbi:FG-GAP-like repeat-containing protein [Streptomyces subrutilus]|uniref:FG-GAP-like repeat-containing protein n=1 Tax=Streptomyces subrutilus TaxID=36818 RepID=UPI00342310BE